MKYKEKEQHKDRSQRSSSRKEADDKNDSLESEFLGAEKFKNSVRWESASRGWKQTFLP